MKKRKRGAALALFHEYPLTFPSGSPLQGQPLPSPAPLGPAPSGATPWRANSLGEPLPWGATPLGSQPPWGVRSLGEPLPWGAKTPLGGPAPFLEQSLPQGAKAPLGGPLPREPPLAGPSSRGTHGFTSLKLFPPAGKMSHLWAVRAPAFPWCIHCRLLARRGLQRRAVRRREEHAYPVCRAEAHAAGHARATLVGRLTGMRDAPDRRARVSSMPCCWACRSACRTSLWGGIKRRAVRRGEEHAYQYAVLMLMPVRRKEEHAHPVCLHVTEHAGAPLVGRLEEARGAPDRRARVSSAPCRWPHRMLVHPLWGGFKGRAVRHREEHAYPVCRAARAAVHAGAPPVGRL